MTKFVALRRLPTLALALLVSVAMGQDGLPIEEALRLAKERNGTVRAAYANVDAARSRTRQSLGAFMPSVTPSYRYFDQRQEQSSGGVNAFSSKGSRTEIEASWRLLDSGERFYAYEGSRRGYDAQMWSTLQTLRTTLFAVHQQYYDALRAQELQKVAAAQVQRAEKVVDQAKVQAEVGAAPRKDILQAEADFLNAKVQLLAAQNRVTTTQSSLRATIGWEPGTQFPALSTAPNPTTTQDFPELEAVIAKAMTQRADLLSQRATIASREYDVRTAERRAGLQWSVDATYTKGWSPGNYSNRSLNFLVSLPLFDGAQSRESLNQAKLGVTSSRLNLVQSEREARAEVESEFLNYRQNHNRLEAARLALEAARLNYNAAEESFAKGAEGTSVVVVLTAQVSLVTAESNFIEAQFDALISEVRLRLVTGDPLPGEA